MSGSTQVGAEVTRPAFWRRPRLLLGMVTALFGAGLLTYALTVGFVWDEGFHLVAAQLIAWGKTPYIDFIFPQTLLNAYFNAAVLRYISETWRAVHFFDSLFVIAATWLSADYVLRRFPVPKWALPCALSVLLMVGFNTVLVAFGPVAQAYGSGTLLAVAAFRVAVNAINDQGLKGAFFTGLLAGAAAGSTLLTAPLLPVLFIWLAFFNTSGSRWKKLTAFSLAIVIAFVPEIWLFVLAPKQTVFNVVQYQALFRRVNWGDATSHDFDVFTDFTVSSQALILGFLAIVGWLYLRNRSGWERPLRREFYLAFAIALSLGVYISTAHPTFGRYFVFMIPFAAIVASVGLFYVGSQLLSPQRPFWPLAIVAIVFATGAAKYIFDDRDGTHWSDYEKIAKKIRSVTPLRETYFADEMVYFLLRQTPPSGMEFSYSHKLELSPAESRLYRIVPQSEIKKQVAAGRYATFETCKDDLADDYKLSDYYSNREDFDDCSVYWNRIKKQ